MKKVNLAEAFGKFSEQWSPKIAGEVNDFAVKLCKIQGEFIWHHHAEEDELFLVISGRLGMKLRDQDDLMLEAGEFVIIPHGVEHLPYAEAEVQMILLERKSTLNTGTEQNERTVEQLETLD
ncbi:MAG: cupin domain-containing protein [Armatimonadetes bacterium]|nr:cupin domain-containing protein [Anaerolineae bacterium]